MYEHFFKIITSNYYDKPKIKLDTGKLNLGILCYQNL